MKIEIEVSDKAIDCQHKFSGTTCLCSKCELPMALLEFVPHGVEV